jgi:hypothetical protein
VRLLTGILGTHPYRGVDVGDAVLRRGAAPVPRIEITDDEEIGDDVEERLAVYAGVRIAPVSSYRSMARAPGL